MSTHRCCCDEDGGCQCRGDCNDFDKSGSITEDDCWDCCWSPGDALRYKANWGTSTYTRRQTTYPGTPTAGPQCADVDYSGGSIEVEYLVVGCSRVCPNIHTGRVKVIFALNTSFADVHYVTGTGWVKDGTGFRYPLYTYLAMVCQTVTSGTGNGDYAWYGYTNCELPALLKPCVALCRTGCTDVDYEPCNGATATSFCSGGGAGFDPPSPDFYNCDHCVDAVVNCGGLKSYCCHRWVSSQCAFNGNEYGQYTDPVTLETVCDYGCGSDAVNSGFHPVTTCTTAVTQTLELVPPVGAERNCRWHEWTDTGVDYQCCKPAAVTGGDDVDLPGNAVPNCPSSQSYPDTGWSGTECDCFVNPVTPANCDEVECNATTTLVSSGELVVCT